VTERVGLEQLRIVPACELPAVPRDSDGTSRPQALDFTGIFDSEFDYVWHTLRRLGVREADLEDLTHDVFFAVYQRGESYDPSRPLRPWLFGFAFRVASSYRRRSRFRHEVAGEPIDLPAEGPSALDRAVQRQTADLAREALDSLELGRRAVFILHELDEFAMPEVASALEIPLNTAYSRLRLARAELTAAVHKLRERGLP
jgi:RNA polymerase sigma-70 factor (ECF subfamily)